MVVLGLALVRAKGLGVAPRQQRPVPHGGRGQVVARAQRRLVQEHVAGALGHDDAVELDADLARGREDLDALVGVFGVVAEELLVFDEPLWCGGRLVLNVRMEF